jgi:hypothetical protein
MPPEFEFQDLHDAVFWGVNLRGSTFRDVDLSDTNISHARLANVEIDAFVDQIVINGVDVTAYVNEHDRWYPARALVHASDPDGMRRGWALLDDAWAGLVERAQGLSDAQRNERVDGEWSFVETLRHLVFAIDKWFTAPILGDGFHPIGLPNSGSVDFPWPDLNRDASPTFDDALAVWQERSARFREYLAGLDASELDRVVEVLENGPNPVRECVFTVLEETFEHNRYAERDLKRLG